MKPKVLVLCGDGINCERETAQAFSLVGADSVILHINELLKNPKLLQDVQILAIPGGFSFSDDLGSGQILAIKIKSILLDSLRDFIDRKKPIIGICNGFQVLLKLALLPKPFGERSITLSENSSGTFINSWVKLEVDKGSSCIWSKDLDGIEDFFLPIRHKEGKVVLLPESEDVLHAGLSASGQIPFRYHHDVNGSYQRIAGICDPSGLILGMMPHPEAAISNLQHAFSSSLENRLAEGHGLRIFRNGIRYVTES